MLELQSNITPLGAPKVVPIVILGYGNIGQQLVQVLYQQQERIAQQIGAPLQLLAVANSRFFDMDPNGLLAQPLNLTQANDESQIWDALQSWRGMPLVVVDLTASETVASLYPNFAQHGWHIISANKLAAADDMLAPVTTHLLNQKGRMWLKNTTVGAALPVQKSLQLLRASGDQVQSVSGVFSGSLSWLFGQYDGDRPFMDWVKQAQQEALTEPDPREDLSGLDVFRKAKILARELGVMPEKVEFEPVLSDDLLGTSEQAFWDNQTAINAHIENLWQQANERDCVLCYLAEVDAQGIRIGLQAVDRNHPSAHLKPGDNIFITKTAWYGANPLVIQGPGAGREVTASGVLTDLIEVLKNH